MRIRRSIVAACVFAAALSAGAHPAAAQDETAANVRKLDIMLMVTSLRCRTGEHDFQADYRRFAAKHLDHLNEANRQLRRSLTAKHGAKGSKRALDRIGVSLANSYGGGHPWLDCAALKEATRDLASAVDSAQLYDAAKRLLAPTQESPTTLAVDQKQPQATPRDIHIPYRLPGTTPMVASHKR